MDKITVYDVGSLLKPKLLVEVVAFIFSTLILELY